MITLPKYRELWATRKDIHVHWEDWQILGRFSHLIQAASWHIDNLVLFDIPQLQCRTTYSNHGMWSLNIYHGGGGGGGGGAKWAHMIRFPYYEQDNKSSPSNNQTRIVLRANTNSNTQSITDLKSSWMSVQRIERKASRHRLNLKSSPTAESSPRSSSISWFVISRFTNSAGYSHTTISF